MVCLPCLLLGSRTSPGNGRLLVPPLRWKIMQGQQGTPFCLTQSTDANAPHKAAQLIQMHTALAQGPGSAERAEVGAGQCNLSAARRPGQNPMLIVCTLNPNPRTSSMIITQTRWVQHKWWQWHTPVMPWLAQAAWLYQAMTSRVRVPLRFAIHRLCYWWWRLIYG